MEINVKFTPKQAIAYSYLTDNVTTEILFGGSAGGGKSFIGCAWIIINCINYPATRWLIGRSILKNLKETTLVTFFEILGLWGFTKEHYSYNQQSGIITFYNGSEVILKDLFTYPSDPNFDSLGGLEISGAFLDEVNQISEKAKNIVSSRIRYKLDCNNLIPKLMMSCNPAKNWVYDKFYKMYKDDTLEDYKKFIPALVTDNRNVSKHYFEQLSKLDDISRRRLLYGEWEYEDGNALMKYDNIVNIFKDFKKQEQYTSYYITCDVARKGKDKAVIYLWGDLDIIRTYEMNISLIPEIVTLINNIKNEFRINNNHVIIDGDGVGGGVVDYLPGCIDFVNNSKPLNSENYQNLKTQCYYKLAEYINDNKISVFDFEVEQRNKLIQELSIITRKNADSDGKLQIISKDEIKTMIGRSPDYSDAMMMRMHFEFKDDFVPFMVKLRR